MWKGFKNIILHVIWPHCMNFMNIFWVTITYWTFEMPKTLHHNPYHIIMDLLHLLKCLIEWFFLHGEKCDATDTKEDNFERFWKP
jgi:hypothetical protein